MNYTASAWNQKGIDHAKLPIKNPLPGVDGIEFTLTY